MSPTGRWTLDRLRGGLDRDGIPIERSQIRRRRQAERIKWPRPRTRPVRDAPAFAGTRGAASGSTPPGPWSGGAHRPHDRPGDARRGSGRACGALDQRGGAVLPAPAAARDTASWRPALDALGTFAPRGDVCPSAGALPLRWTVDTLRRNWGHPRSRFGPPPTAAARRNLLAGCWKARNRRARAGRACRTVAAVETAPPVGVAAWDRRPAPRLWGRPAQPRRQLKRAYA